MGEWALPEPPVLALQMLLLLDLHELASEEDEYPGLGEVEFEVLQLLLALPYSTAHAQPFAVLVPLDLVPSPAHLVSESRHSPS